MKWISDDDEQRIREAKELLGKLKCPRCPGSDVDNTWDARVLLDTVLSSIQRLAQEQPHPAPRIRELSEAEQRVFYPERHK